MLLLHAQREANQPCPQLLPAPALSHTGMVQAGSVRATRTTKQPRKETQFLATQQSPKIHPLPISQETNQMVAVVARRVSRGHAVRKEASHASERGFVKPPVQRIGPLLVNHCS